MKGIARSGSKPQRNGLSPLHGTARSMLIPCGRNGENSMPISETETRMRIVRPEHAGARVTVRVQPEESLLSLPRPKTARQLLEALGLAEESALVARQG